MLPVTQPKICFHIPASPTDGFFSQIAMFRLALDALGGAYKEADIVLTLGDEEIVPLPKKWKSYFGNTVKLNWADPELYKKIHFGAQGDARWKYDHDGYDLVIFCDADTLLVRQIDDVLIKMQQFPAVMGVIAHYPFSLSTKDDNNQVWTELAERFTGKKIDFKYRHTLVSDNDQSASAICPFYLNFGFVVMTPNIINILKNTYLNTWPKIASVEKIKYPVFSPQIALTLSLLTHDIPTHELGLRYNFPNDPIADRLHPKELEDVRLIHYLRTDKFDRQTIFTNEAAFNEFLSLNLDGSNKIFQDYVRKLTGGRYPFKSGWSPVPETSKQSVMKTESKKVIVVLGMHRGGTSTVTRSLQVLGVGLGNNLYPPGEDNPTGFWEDRECIAINEELLGHFGSDYDRLGLARDFNVDDPSLNHLYSRAVQLVTDSLAANAGIWGVKDPRMCRLLGFWKKVFEACNCHVEYIIALRDPISVAQSLENRNHIPSEKSYLLWLQHMIPAVLDTRDARRTVVSYDLLLETPEEQIARLAKHLGIPFEIKGNARLSEFAETFLDASLRHAKHSMSQISWNSRLPRDAVTAYELFMSIAKDEISINSDEAKQGLEQIQNNLKAYAPAFEYANLLETEIERLSLQSEQNEDQPEAGKTNLVQSVTTGKVQLMITLAERDAQISNLHQSLETLSSQWAEKERTVQTLSSQVAEKDQALQTLSSQLTEKNQSIDHLSSEITRKDQEFQTLSSRLARINQEVDVLSAGIAQYKGELWEIKKSRAWKIALLMRQIRFLLAPPNSSRARVLRFLSRAFASRSGNAGENSAQDIELVRSSDLFDEMWYLNHYPDIAEAKMDPAAHYTRYGGFEGRDPGPAFSSSWYLSTYKDIKKARINPLVHYLEHGRQENRSPGPAPSVPAAISPVQAPEQEKQTSASTSQQPGQNAGSEPVKYEPPSAEFLQAGVTMGTDQALKIVLVVHQFVPEYSSGTEVLTYETAKALQKLGHHVIVFTGYPASGALTDNERFDRYVHDGIRVERFHHGYVPMGDQLNTMEMEYNNTLFGSYFREFLKHEKPDIVHFFHLARLSASPIDACNELNIPTVLTPTDFWFICHTSHLRWPGNQPCPGPDKHGVNCLRHVVEIHQFKKVDALFQRLPDWVIAMMIFFIKRGFNIDGKYSPYVRALAHRREFLLEKLNRIDRVVIPTKVMMSSLVHNGLDVHRTISIPFGLNLSYLYNAKRPEPGNVLRLGYIGTLYEHKGVHVLVEAVRKLRGQPVELHIYGKLSDFPDYVQRLRDIIQDDTRIQFCGTFPNHEIGSVFSSLDALVVPSLWHENAPLVIFSAQAAGCPVIASNKEGMSEVIEHGKNGLLFEAGNVDELASTIQSLLNDNQLLQSLSRNAKRPLSIEEYATRLCEIYMDLIQKEKTT